jgi:hypothetical protein
MGFNYVQSGSVALWTGDPNCQNGHDYMRTWLRTHISPYPVTWIDGDTRTQGNLGEALAFCVAKFGQLDTYRPFVANAFAPFSGISRNEIDILWIGFGPTPADDRAIIQEVKTTFAQDLAYAKQLLPDYEKAFGVDPKVQFNTHLGKVKVELEMTHKRPDLAKRVNALTATTPANAKRIVCIPTLVHDLAGADPAGTLSAIKSAMLAKGWVSVHPWSIALSEIKLRFPRIAQDQP